MCVLSWGLSISPQEHIMVSITALSSLAYIETGSLFPLNETPISLGRIFYPVRQANACESLSLILILSGPNEDPAFNESLVPYRTE